MQNYVDNILMTIFVKFQEKNTKSRGFIKFIKREIFLKGKKVYISSADFWKNLQNK